MSILLGFRKKVSALAKQKDCQLFGEWERSLVNHLYWCVVSTADGGGDVIKAKWLSVDNHIHNVHSGHSQLFQKCSHGVLEGRESQKSGSRDLDVSVHHMLYILTYIIYSQ